MLLHRVESTEFRVKFFFTEYRVKSNVSVHITEFRVQRGVSEISSEFIVVFQCIVQSLELRFLSVSSASCRAGVFWLEMLAGSRVWLQRKSQPIYLELLEISSMQCFIRFFKNNSMHFLPTGFFLSISQVWYLGNINPRTRKTNVKRYHSWALRY